MRTRIITLESKEFGPLTGKALTVREPETIAEALGLCETDADVLERLTESLVRMQNNYARSRAASIIKAEPDAEKALAALQAAVDSHKYARRKDGSAAPRGPRTPQGKANAIAQASASRLFEKCEADAQFLARVVKSGVVDQAEYEAWKTAKDAARAAEVAKG